jgi:hypothetical protein
MVQVLQYSQCTETSLGTLDVIAVFTIVKKFHVLGSIPDEVFFLNLPNPSGCTSPWGLLSL